MIPEYFAYITILIALISISLYIRDILKGKVKPNKITWLFWGIAPIIGSYIGYESGVSLPLLATTFMSGFGCILVFIVAIFHKNAYWKITAFDIACGLISAVAMIIWLTTKNGTLALVFAILADLAAGIPTMIKSWKHSDTETLAPYALGILNVFITFLVIKDFSFINFAFPAYLVISNTIIILGIRSKN
jgi:hypothetical protein